MQERNKVLQEENDRLTSERDAALANLRESQENVLILQQAIEVHTYSVMYNDYKPCIHDLRWPILLCHLTYTVYLLTSIIAA